MPHFEVTLGSSVSMVVNLPDIAALVDPLSASGKRVRKFKSLPQRAQGRMSKRAGRAYGGNAGKVSIERAERPGKKPGQKVGRCG